MLRKDLQSTDSPTVTDLLHRLPNTARPFSHATSSSTIQMEAVDCSKNTRNYQHTRRPIQDSSKVHSHRHKNLKCHVLFLDSKTGFPACSIQTCIQCLLIRVTPFSVHYLYYVYPFPLVISCFHNTVTRHQMCYHSLLMLPLSLTKISPALILLNVCAPKKKGGL